MPDPTPSPSSDPARHPVPDPVEAQLSRLLHTWEVPTDPPAGFADAVRSRVHRRQAPSEALPLRQMLIALLARWLARPGFAVAYVVLALLVGAGTGALRGHAAAKQLAGGMQGRYVQFIDPFAHGVMR